MKPRDLWEVAVGVKASRLAYEGKIDLDLVTIPCPGCGQRQMRNEFREEFRTLAEVARMFRATEAEMLVALRRGTFQRDSLGRYKCAIPYVTCMACGADIDATTRPEDYRA